MCQMAVAMSGGVDSSVAAALMLKEGYSLIGLTMVRDDSPSAMAMVRGARQVAGHLGIPHRVIRVGDEFNRWVVDPFVEGYLSGFTPNPCVVCNPMIKFGLLLSHALKMGAEGLATGHYARISPSDTGKEMRLLRAVDQDKDQSYVLYRLRQAHLRRTRFPLGSITKSRVRSLARRLDLAPADKEESQEICFVSGDYRVFLEERAGERLVHGPILDLQGRVVGCHRGLAHYTVGQRRGLQIAGPDPHYVVELDPSRNAVIVGSREDLSVTRILVRQVSWVRRPGETPLDLAVRVRYRSPLLPARLEITESGEVQVYLSSPAQGVAPGQSAVFYRGDEVLGGGIIARESRQG